VCDGMVGCGLCCICAADVVVHQVVCGCGKWPGAEDGIRSQMSARSWGTLALRHLCYGGCDNSVNKFSMLDVTLGRWATHRLPLLQKSVGESRKGLVHCVFPWLTSVLWVAESAQTLLFGWNGKNVFFGTWPALSKACWFC